MQKEDWVRVAKMLGYVYIPIALLILFIFLVVQYQSSKIEQAETDSGALAKPKLIVPPPEHILEPISK